MVDPDLLSFDDDQPGESKERERLDLARLGEMLRERRGALSIRQAAQEAGVSFSTLSRVEGGAQPDLSTFTLLCGWLGVAPSRFFMPVAERDLSPVERAITHLHADPRLSDEAAGQIGRVLKEMYDVLAREVAPRPVVACHLRAASTMRPGVPVRLASLLSDMYDALQRQAEAGQL